VADSPVADPGAAPEKTPLRVLIGCDTFAPDVNGAAKFAERLAAGLVARGHDVHVVAPAAGRKHGSWFEVHEGQPMMVHRLKSWRWYPHPWLRFALPWRIEANGRKIVDEVKPDVVHFQSHIVVGRGLSKAAIERGIRLIGTNHFMPDNAVQFSLIPQWFVPTAIRMLWNAADRSFRRAEAVTTPTRRAAAFLEAHTSLNQVHAISCGIDMHNYTPNFEPRTENRVVFVGRVEEEKKLDVLLKAVALMDPKLHVNVEIVGDGEHRKALENLAVELGIRSNVHFAGRVSDEELRAALTRASVFAIASIAELQSIATMEAMASGLPVVAADAMALPHLVHHGENGFLFTPGDSAEMAARLTEVLTLPEDEYLAMKNESLRIVEMHDIERTLETFERLYRGEIVTDPVTEVPRRSASARLKAIRGQASGLSRRIRAGRP
jgi:glycosyltransferase involved in cell wall biosynthesis